MRLFIGPTAIRRRGLAAEARFWRGWFDLPEANLNQRLDPRITEPTVLECLAEIAAQEVTVLDVGAGPLSTLGTAAPGKRVHLTAVDPLAITYDKVLRERGVTPLVRTEQCAGEDLLTRFARDHFDLAFSENALDHAADPLKVIADMLDVVKPGGFVVLNHAPNEGDRVDYGTLHQWNFSERDGRCILWRPGAVHELVDKLPGTAQRCSVELRSDGPRVVCVLTKAALSPPAAA